ncbi:DUF4291 family protein [Streptomyces sp. Amel2xB2]|uniref:DUF4291 family protein n=1 Tax=Streptomyces sp. Amel2xB2 TaxID=1305829 RepID=UPI000DBA5214
MYRSGWGGEPGQGRVPAVELSRSGFEWAPAHASPSHHGPAVHRAAQEWRAQKENSPVRVQWDPCSGTRSGPCADRGELIRRRPVLRRTHSHRRPWRPCGVRPFPAGSRTPAVG